MPIRPWRPVGTLCTRLIHLTPRAAYHSKVRAMPFVVSKDEAIEAMKPIAASQNLQPVDMLKSLAKRIFTSIEVPAQVPSRIQGVYIPTWIMDAEVEARVYGMDEGEDSGASRPVIAHFLNSFLPGFTYDPLSRLCFGRRGLLDKLQFVPFSDDLRTQLGSDVLCLPYTTSPLSLLEAARSLTRPECEFGPGLRFDPATIQTPLLAAYPVLMPVYVASYEFEVPSVDDEKKFTLTLMMDASITGGVVYIDARDGWSQLDEDTMKIVKRLTPAGFDPATDILTNEKSVEAFLDIPAGPRGLEGHLNMLAIDKLRAPSTGTQYKSSDNRVDMDDLRIRPWSWDDSRQHNQYIMHGVQIDLARRAREQIQRLSGRGAQVHAIIEKDGKVVSESDGPNAVLETMSDNIKELEKKREDLKPEWLRTFGQLQKRARQA